MQFQIGVKAIIEYEGKILLIRRSDKYKNMVGFWDIPGGRIDSGEEPEAGLKREIMEETGLKVKQVKQILDASIVFKDEERQIVRITYHVYAQGNQVKMSEEHTEFIWIEPTDIDFELKDHLIKKSIIRLNL